MHNEEIASWIVLGVVGLVCLSYVITRVASYAHFRSKLEFLQKLTQDGGKDGEGKI